MRERRLKSYQTKTEYEGCEEHDKNVLEVKRVQKKMEEIPK